MNGFIWNSEKINENVGVQKTGMAEKVLWMVVYGLRAFHRNPGGKPDYRGTVLMDYLCVEIVSI